MFCALLGQDIRWAFTGPLVLWFSHDTAQDTADLRKEKYAYFFKVVKEIRTKSWENLSVYIGD